MFEGIKECQKVYQIEGGWLEGVSERVSRCVRGWVTVSVDRLIG